MSARTLICLAAASLALATLSEAGHVFNVVAFGTTAQVQVNGGTPITLKKFNNQPYFTGETEVAAKGPIRYKFIVNGEAENFEREFPAGRTTTFNDFFNRKETVKPLPKFGLVFEGEKNAKWTKGMGQVKPFDETYIPTVHLTGMTNFFANPPEEDEWQPTNAFLILKDEVKTFQGVKICSGNTKFKKFAFKLQLSTPYYGRSIYKFRYGEEDPTLLREKIYTDMLEAVGAPVHQTGMIRVYSDGKPIGLYILQDNPASEAFLETEFHGGRSTVLGPIYDAQTGSDFGWTPTEGDKTGNFEFTGAAPTEHKIGELAKELYGLDVNNPSAVASFDQNWFDIDVFFKAMALEYLTGHWDSYMGMTTNYVAYNNPDEKNKFYFIDMDFEMTFGSSMNECYNKYGSEFPKQSYKTMLGRTWRCDAPRNFDLPHRAMWDKLLSSPALASRFEKSLVAIVKHMFNPVAMGRRMDALAGRYREEVAWDRTIARRSDGMTWGFVASDFDSGFENNDVHKGGIVWGMKPFVAERATAVSQEFNFEWDKTPRDIAGVSNSPIATTVVPGEGPVVTVLADASARTAHDSEDLKSAAAASPSTSHMAAFVAAVVVAVTSVVSV